MPKQDLKEDITLDSQEELELTLEELLEDWNDDLPEESDDVEWDPLDPDAVFDDFFKKRK